METEPEKKQEPAQEAIQDNSKQVEVSQPEETPEQINWKKFREQREIERKQRELAEKKAAEKAAEAEALKAAMEAILTKPSTNLSEISRSQYSEEEETEEQKIDKRVQAALEARERQFQQERNKREQEELPQRLSQTYSDFNQVCNQENLDYLEYHYPEIASAFKRVPDSFEKWSDVYKAVKRFIPNTESRKEQAKAEKNFNKPQSMSVSGVTQTGDTTPVMLDDKRRSDNWARMQRVMRGGR